MQVTSVSKKEQSLSKAGAAVYVITQEDIRRSGMMNIPDLLRMAPGVDVARLDSNAWAISIRGFNDRYSNKVLVLIDGRSVYSEVFSGVYWDQQNVPLEDIDRIEVIRGPGGTVWGANAVNGVINIITKNSRDTQGGLVTAETGSEENLEGLVQYGGKIGKGTYRTFGNYFNIEPSRLRGGGEGADGWHGSHGGFRADWNLSARDTLTVEGDLLQTAEGQTLTSVLANQLPLAPTFNDRTRVGAGNLQGQYSHTFSDGSELSVLTYYDRFQRHDEGDSMVENANVDLDYHFRLGSRNDLVAGAGYRLTASNYKGLYDAYFFPDHRADNLFSLFLQDEIALTHNLTLTLGTKLEHNVFTGFEYQPSAQLVWTPKDRQNVWLSAARAIRQPSALDETVQIAASVVPLQNGNFGVVELSGNPQLNAEKLIDYELGYRSQLNRRMSFDVATFLSNYSDLRTTEPGAPFFTSDPEPPHLVLPAMWGNFARARNYGVELFGSWNVTNWWRLSPGFSFLHMNVQPLASSGDATVGATSGYSPKHQAQLRSSVKLSHRLEWDTSAYIVGVLGNGPVPAYTRLDTHLGWTAGESVYFSVSGQNLLTPLHVEFVNGYQVNPTQIERSVVGKITWRF